MTGADRCEFYSEPVTGGDTTPEPIGGDEDWTDVQAERAAWYVERYQRACDLASGDPQETAR
jgi:hypothetical protein